jgi:hypothetical protein
MKNSETFHFGDEPTTEVELSATDLLQLSSPPTLDESAHSDKPRALEQHASVVTEIARSAQPLDAPPPPPMSRRVSAGKIALPLGLAAAVVAAIGVQHNYSTPEDSSRSALVPAPSQAAPVAETESTTESDQPPLRFKNPFDSSEVFEFPAGTSNAEARDAVAELLLKRATEREEQLHAQR